MWAIFASLDENVLGGHLRKGQSQCQNQLHIKPSNNTNWHQLVKSVHLVVMKLTCVIVLAFAFGALAQESFESTGIRMALKIYDDCNKGDGFSPCLKKKAITFLDRLGRMEKISLAEGVIVSKSPDAPVEPTVTEEQLDSTLPRSDDAKDQALNTILLDKVSKLVGSRSIELTLPKLDLEEGITQLYTNVFLYNNFFL